MAAINLSSSRPAEVAGLDAPTRRRPLSIESQACSGSRQRPCDREGPRKQNRRSAQLLDAWHPGRWDGTGRQGGGGGPDSMVPGGPARSLLQVLAGTGADVLEWLPPRGHGLCVSVPSRRHEVLLRGPQPHPVRHCGITIVRAAVCTATGHGPAPSLGPASISVLSLYFLAAR